MGVPDVMNPIVGETYVELNEMPVQSLGRGEQEDVVDGVVTGNANEILMQKPCEEILGIELLAPGRHGLETLSGRIVGATAARIPSDGLNLVANARWSQKVENGTLANYGMQFYEIRRRKTAGRQSDTIRAIRFLSASRTAEEDVLQSVTIPEMARCIQELDWIDTQIQGVTAATGRLGAADRPNGQIRPANGTGDSDACQQGQGARAERFQIPQTLLGGHRQYLRCALVMANGGEMAQPKLYKKSAGGKYLRRPSDLQETFIQRRLQGQRSARKADKESDSLQHDPEAPVAQHAVPEQCSSPEDLQGEDA